MTHCE